jgi:hypothetical protein
MLRNMSGRVGLALAVLLLAGMTVMAPQASASASRTGTADAAGELAKTATVAGPDDGIGTAAVAPTCVYRFFEEHWYAFHLHGQNNCAGRRYVKVIIAFGPDSGCIGLDRGQSFTHSWQMGRYDRLDSC